MKRVPEGPRRYRRDREHKALSTKDGKGIVARFTRPKAMPMRPIALAVLMTAAQSLIGQQWWAPGACWVYKQLHLTPSLDVYMNSGDTLLDGFVAQRCMTRTCYLGSDTICNSDVWQFRDFVSLQGDVVYYKHSWTMNSPWDTLYYLGVPGDFWYPLGFDPDCDPLGKLVIADTGHVVMGGVSLRTWDIDQLDSDGVPMAEDMPFNQDPLRVIERIGGTPRVFTNIQCNPGGIIEYSYFNLLHYSDWELSTNDGLSCDLVLGSAERTSERGLTSYPNPGTDHLQLSGFGSSSAQVNVRDALGRLCFSTRNYRSGERIRAESWAPGSYYISVTDRSGNGSMLRWLKQ